MYKNKILIVEDEALIAKDIEKILLDLGYSVCVILTMGSRVVSKIVGENPDLVLLDIMFHNQVRGIDIARKVRAKLDVPIVYLTAHSERDIVKKAKITEPFGYIIKPFENQELYTIIEIVLYRQKEEKLPSKPFDYAEVLKEVNALLKSKER